MKLYKVNLTSNIVVVAKDEQEAIREAEAAVLKGDEYFDVKYATPIFSKEQLPKEWFVDYAPWGGAWANKTIEQWLNEDEIFKENIQD